MKALTIQLGSTVLLLCTLCVSESRAFTRYYCPEPRNITPTEAPKGTYTYTAHMVNDKGDETNIDLKLGPQPEQAVFNQYVAVTTLKLIGSSKLEISCIYSPYHLASRSSILTGSLQLQHGEICYGHNACPSNSPSGITECIVCTMPEDKAPR
ncbi:MAG TPA: hypothetical protein VMW10_12945 [Alphaproteobacteria bacterium]|nr:hypothetical protein [Alphaproteobacteria bacterium]